MKVYVFPGQGAQFVGMGKEQYEQSAQAKALFEEANEALGFSLSDVMFNGSEEDLRKTDITQPAIYTYSYIMSQLAGETFKPDAVAGHSLGEFTALAASGVLSFRDGLKLVSQRAKAMRKACDEQAGTMAAILGLNDEIIEACCENIDGTVVAANYNCPGQLVISGAIEAIDSAVAELKEKGARRALVLPVGGAFHSPLMSSAKEALAEAISNTEFNKGSCPIYQNVTGQASDDLALIKKNLELQLTAPVLWTQSMKQMISDGMEAYVEVGAKVLTGMLKKLNREISTSPII